MWRWSHDTVMSSGGHKAERGTGGTVGSSGGGGGGGGREREGERERERKRTRT